MAKTDSRTDVQNQAAREHAERKAELEAVRYLMQTPLGRSLAARLLDVSGVDRATAFQPNAMVMAHDHGVQQMGFFLRDEIRAACPELELVMRQEVLKRETRATMADEADNE